MAKGIIGISIDAVRPFIDLTVDSALIDRDKLKEVLLLPDRYTIDCIVRPLTSIKRIDIIVSSPDIPEVRQGVMLPFVTPYYRRDDDYESKTGTVSLTDIKVGDVSVIREEDKKRSMTVEIECVVTSKRMGAESTRNGENIMTEQEFIERLASAEHESWARWMDYLFNRCDLEKGKDGFRYVIPRELVERWKRQVGTLYEDLSEREKQSDRDEVAHILPIIEEYKTSQRSAIKYFKLNTFDAGQAMEKVWKAQTAAGLKKTAFHLSGGMEVSVWTEDALGEIMLRNVLRGMNIEYEEGNEQQVKTFLDEMFGSIDKEEEQYD